MELNLEELNIGDISNWSLPIKAASAAVLVVILLVLGYFFHTSSQSEQLDNLIKQEEDLKQQLESQYARLGVLKQDVQMIKFLSEHLSKLSTSLPSPSEFPHIIEAISQAGAASQLQFQMLDPLPQKETPLYIEIPIKIVASGTYNQIANFISQLANGNYLILIGDFKLVDASILPQSKNKPAHISSPTENSQLIDFNAEVYLLPTTVPVKNAPLTSLQKSASFAPTKLFTKQVCV